MRKIVSLAVLFVLSVTCVHAFAEDCGCGGPPDRNDTQAEKVE